MIPAILNQDYALLPAIIRTDTNHPEYPGVLDYTLWRDIGYPRGFSISVDNISYSYIYNPLYDFSSVTSLDDVAMVIQNVLNTNSNIVTVIFDSETSQFVITTVSVGPSAVIQILNDDVTEDIRYWLGMFEQQTVYGS